MVVAYAYSQTVNAQYNPNFAKKFNDWEHEANAVGNTNTFAQAKITKEGTKDKPVFVTPLYLTAHDFRLNIPSDAYIKKLTFEVNCKVTSTKAKVKVPNVWFMFYGDTSRDVSRSAVGKTGWNNGVYRIYPSSYLSTSDKTYYYSMSEDDLKKGKVTANKLNQSITGIDIHFDNVDEMNTSVTHVKVKWVRVRVEYDVPEYYLTYSPLTTASNPLEVNVGKSYKVKAEFGNRTKAKGGTQQVNIKLPFGTFLDSYSPSSENLSVVDDHNFIWSCNGGALAKNNITLNLQSNLVGLRNIISSHGDIDYLEYINPIAFQNGDYVECNIESGDINQLRPSCFYFTAMVNSDDGNVAFEVVVENQNRPNHSLVSSALKEAYNKGSNGNYLVNWELIEADDGVSIDYAISDGISFNVPPNTDVEIKFKGCFLPIGSGMNSLLLTNLDNNNTYGYDYYCNPFDNLEMDIKTDKVVVTDHRVLNNLETDYNVIPFYSNNFDRVMVEQPCHFRMHIQEQVAYIGCVPIKHAHYDPDSSFSNGGLISQYKNKTYTGKKGEIDEDRGLKIWLPKKDWTTLEGLAELDKPIPINTVPSAYEGDVLNHRGWAELTKVKVDEKSPLYYRGSLDLIYLTHNINSRFVINRGVKLIDDKFDTMMGSVVDSGDEFANTTYINQDGETVSNATGYFNVDTDGVYIYDDDAMENQRTLISLDNSQYATITSDEELPEHFNISCEWSSTRIDENRENNFERIIRLFDGDNKAILEYEYYDLKFTDEQYYKCTVQCRVMTSSGWITVFENDMNLSADLESLQLTRDAVTGELVSESEPYIDELEAEDDLTIETEAYTYSDYTYGSTVHFNLNMNQLEIIDEGVSGRELSQTVLLDYAPRSYQLMFKNKNVDGDTNDVITFFDFEVEESVLLSDFEKDYSDLLVSSFPVPNRDLLFTRDSQEGVIYYYKDDGRLFSYIQEPFYMYFKGVDLKVEDDISIFNLNNSYRVFYLQNGLVRIGFDRFEGEIYLAKYDIYSKQYINVSYLQLSNYSEFHIGAYSDDKIEVCVGTTVFTMYRGHPYVVIKHEDDDIQFKSVWNRVFGESVNGEAHDLPSLWELANYNNMLPTEIGGDNVDVSGWIVDSDDEEEDANRAVSLNLQKHTNDAIYNNEDVIFDVSGTVTSSGDNLIDEKIPVDEVTTFTGFLGDYEISIEVDETVPNNPYSQN
ncbi:MAG: hypothetical protein IJF83_11035 [Methanobrevibacter sp.]|nr:hypothetical protein [Methanobrevibacter sp.]